METKASLPLPQAVAAIRHGEPSCQLPHRKMLRGWGGPSVGVCMRTTLGVLYFCLTGEGKDHCQDGV